MLETLKKWLLKPAETTTDKIMIGSSAFLTKLLWLTVVMIPLLTFLELNQYSHPEYLALFFGCIMAPLWEELAFRVAPIQIVKALGNDKLLMPVIVISSLLFGWGHGYGTVSLLIQGVGGFILSCVYVKTNYNYWVVVAMHAAWNIWAIFIAA